MKNKEKFAKEILEIACSGNSIAEGIKYITRDMDGFFVHLWHKTT